MTILKIHKPITTLLNYYNERITDKIKHRKTNDGNEKKHLKIINEKLTRLTTRQKTEVQKEREIFYFPFEIWMEVGGGKKRDKKAIKN